MTARLRAILLALVTIVAVIAAPNSALAHPGHGALTNHDASDYVYYRYLYVGKTYYANVNPGSAASHSYDVEAFYTGTCWKTVVKWYAGSTYAYTLTYTGPYWAAVGNDRTAVVTSKYKYC